VFNFADMCIVFGGVVAALLWSKGTDGDSQADSNEAPQADEAVSDIEVQMALDIETEADSGADK
jgi:hypothetical protein